MHLNLCTVQRAIVSICRTTGVHTLVHLARFVRSCLHILYALALSFAHLVLFNTLGLFCFPYRPFPPAPLAHGGARW